MPSLQLEPEELSGKEGRLLTRLHVYKERDISGSGTTTGTPMGECCDAKPATASRRNSTVLRGESSTGSPPQDTD